jgi:uncharacterized protein YaiI (UPF0178 family)
VERIRCYAVASGRPVEVVLDVPQADLPEGDSGGVVIRYATRRGRDAADDRIIELLDSRGTVPTQVVTSDRTLAERARRRGAHVIGAGRFLQQLDDAGC